MEYKHLAGTDIKVSRIGFGTWGIGGNPENSLSYGKTDDKESIRALEYALDNGINFFDTSPLYGFGHSEELLGTAFTSKRDKVVFATKVGYKNFNGQIDYSKKYIIESVEDSLRRLKTSYIDIFQLHDVPVSETFMNDELITTLNNLKKDGKIRCIGCSIKSPTEEIDFEKVSLSSIQANFNIIDQRAIDTNLLKNCYENKISFIARTPLGFGFLTGKYNKTNFDNTDHRNRFSKEQIDLWSKSINLFKKDKELSNINIAIGFCLSFKEICTTIPGMISVKEVQENLKSLNINYFNNNILNEFYNIYKNNKFII